MKENNTFFIDKLNNVQKTYTDLLSDINDKITLNKIIQNDNYYELFVEFIASILSQERYLLIDSNLSVNETSNLELTDEDYSKTNKLNSHNLSSFDELLSILNNSEFWRIGFFTSGTTGRPKCVYHTIHSLTRNVKKGDRFQDNIWGFCYNPTHFAGMQVFLQALFNKNPIINLFNCDYDDVEKMMNTYNITHISATPTFYRSLYPYLKNDYPTIERITFGGEAFDSDIAQKYKSIFPNARITNVYASTEVGSIFAGHGEKLKIPDHFKEYIRVSPKNELLVHKSLMGETNGACPANRSTFKINPILAIQQ